MPRIVIMHGENPVTYEVEDGTTPNSFMLSKYPETGNFPMPTICLYEGEPRLREEWDSIALSGEAVLTFVFLPESGGDGGSNPLSVILMAVVVLMAVVIMLAIYTLFLGIMGEKPGSPGEAIMPLTRTSSGDLGIKTLTGGGGANVQVNIIDKREAGAPPARVEQSSDGMGGMRFDVIIDAVDQGLAGHEWNEVPKND